MMGLAASGQWLDKLADIEAIRGAVVPEWKGRCTVAGEP